jgi:pimeloyl-ACP methyl ester carboxylesterase
MAYVDNDGIRIHYQVEGDGPPLVMQHGYTDSIETWYELGYVDALKKGHRLILVDARGHGASDKPHDTAAYANDLRVADIVAVLRELNIPRADYFGYSMGGRIGFMMAQYAPDRVRGLIIGGAGANGASRIGDGFRKALRAGGAGAIPAIWGATLPPALAARLVRNDVVALDACRTDSLGFFNVLPAMTMPCLLYAGSADPNYPMVEETVAEMPNVAFFALPGLGHSEAFLHGELVLPRVIEFLDSVTEGRPGNGRP